MTYPCDECGEQFSLRLKLNEHNAMIHLDTTTSASNVLIGMLEKIVSACNFGELCDEEDYVDETLASDDEQIHAHKMLVDLVQNTSRQNNNQESKFTKITSIHSRL